MKSCLFKYIIFHFIPQGDVEGSNFQAVKQIPKEALEEGIRSVSVTAQSMSEWAEGSLFHLTAEKTQAIYFALSRTTLYSSLE